MSIIYSKTYLLYTFFSKVGHQKFYIETKIGKQIWGGVGKRANFAQMFIIGFELLVFSFLSIHVSIVFIFISKGTTSTRKRHTHVNQETMLVSIHLSSRGRQVGVVFASSTT